MENNFKVRVGEFEGPLDVLLRLIEDKKMHISQVALAAVTDDFIGYMQTLDGGHKNELASFVLIAATLMLIKSISLLPSLTMTPEEEGSVLDLERRLKIYQKLRELGTGIKARFGQQIIFGPESQSQLTPVFVATAEITGQNLLQALRNLVANFPKASLLPQVAIKK